MLRKYITIALSALLLVISGCTTAAQLTTLQYNVTSISDIKYSDGQQVTVVGYMSMLSPLDSSMTYLMDVPFNIDPGKYPINDKLTDFIACYPQRGHSLDFTEQCVKMTGTIVWEEVTDDNQHVSYPFYLKDCSYVIYSDEAGPIYEYNYGVNNGALSVIDGWITAVYQGMASPENATKISVVDYKNQCEVALGSGNCPSIVGFMESVESLSNIYNDWLEGDHTTVSDELTTAYISVGMAMSEWMDTIKVRGDEQ